MVTRSRRQLSVLCSRGTRENIKKSHPEIGASFSSEFDFDFALQVVEVGRHEAGTRQEILLQLHPKLVDVLEAVLIEHRDVVVVHAAVDVDKLRGRLIDLVFRFNFLRFNFHRLSRWLTVLLISSMRSHVSRDHISTTRCVIALRTTIWFFTLKHTKEREKKKLT